MREPPAGFVQRLQQTFGSDWGVRWNDVVRRWEITSTSAAGQPVSQFWGWFYDQKTGEPVMPDPVTGLVPYRGLDAGAQEELVQNLHRSYIGKTGDGLRDWAGYMTELRAFNQELTRSRRRAKAELFADMIAEVDIRRPYLKHHTGTKRGRAVARGA